MLLIKVKETNSDDQMTDNGKSTKVHMVIELQIHTL